MIGQAGHFSFLPKCKPGMVQILEDNAPGDGIICRDGAAENEDVRDSVHAQTTAFVVAFLDAHPPAH